MEHTFAHCYSYSFEFKLIFTVTKVDPWISFTKRNSWLDIHLWHGDRFTSPITSPPAHVWFAYVNLYTLMTLDSSEDIHSLLWQNNWLTVLTHYSPLFPSNDGLSQASCKVLTIHTSSHCGIDVIFVTLWRRDRGRSWLVGGPVTLLAICSRAQNWLVKPDWPLYW